MPLSAECVINVRICIQPNPGWVCKVLHPVKILHSFLCTNRLNWGGTTHSAIDHNIGAKCFALFRWKMADSMK